MATANAQQAPAPSPARIIEYTLFHRSATVGPVQDPGQSSAGVITGRLNADSQDDAPVTYALAEAPTRGRVDIDDDGGYTYTPDEDLAAAGGTDTFSVVVDNGGAFRLTGIGGVIQSIVMSLAQLVGLRQPDTVTVAIPVRIAAVGSPTEPPDKPPVVEPPGLTFRFDYGAGSQYWSEPARIALQWAAEVLAASLVVGTPITVDFSITAERAPDSDTLASAGSDLISDTAGFFATVVQNKILTGVDPNGSQADGEIDVNFGIDWAFGDSVGAEQYDFKSTALHELLHAFGFLSYIDEPGYNLGRNWTEFDRYVVTADDVAVIGGNYRWKGAFNTNLTGGDGGLYFAGPNAVAAYGGLVPVYVPDPWEPGSSGSHLDDFTFTGADALLMNALADVGPGVRVIGDVELGILMDIGYSVAPRPTVAALMAVGLVFLRRTRRGRSI